MDEFITIRKADYDKLNSRLKKLAQEKAKSQIIIDMLADLASVPGIDNIVDKLLNGILSIIGSNNIIIYYKLNDKFFYNDVFGKKKRLDEIDNYYAKKTFETGEFIEYIDDGEKYLEFGDFVNWVFPLIASEITLGVIILEGLIVKSESFKSQMRIYFNLFALVFRNELYGYKSILNANIKLKQTNKDLKKEIKYRVLAESKLQDEKRKAENANKAKSMFLANMSHELRTPLNCIVGSLQLLSLSEHAAKNQKYIHLAKESSTILLRLINDILDYTKIEEGILSIQKANFDLDELLNSVLQSYKLIAENKDIKLIFNKDANIPVNLFGDSLRIRQIIVNLLGNAIKFTEKGEINFCIEKIEKDQKVNDEVNTINLKFLIKDTGIGIAENDINKLFKNFMQLDFSKSKKYQGTGLGLAISKKLVNLMGGKIYVCSKLNVGSTFIFELPLEIANQMTIKN